MAKDSRETIREGPEPVSNPIFSETPDYVGKDQRQDPGEGGLTAVGSVGIPASPGARFRVLHAHAKGGLGEVFVALDTELDREVALKQIQDHRADDPSSRARFLLEAKITGGLEHPGVVPVYALGTDTGGRPYYAMRLIKGDSLKETIERFHRGEDLKRDPGARSLELRRLLRRFLDVCNAVEYAHRRGVVHRDLKPSNIMVGKYGETLVVDWGLAKCVGVSDAVAPAEERALAPTSDSGSPETLPGSKLGTPGYMSPEQAAGDLERIGPATDVYSLGATLYFLLTGRPPFTAANLDQLLQAVQRGDFPPPRGLDSTIPPALEAVCLAAMALKPADRYGTAKALADDVERWMAGEPVTARRETFGERARRWVRRHRTAAIAIVASMLVGLVGLSAVLAVQSRANADLKRSNDRLNEANIALLASNDRERARFELAMATIKRFHTGVSEDFPR